MTEEDKIAYELLRGCTLLKCVAAFTSTVEEADILRDAYHARMEGVTTTYPHGTDAHSLACIGMALAEHHLENGVPA